MIKNLICFLVVGSGYVAVSADGSCVATAPDPTLSPILATGALNFSVNLFNALISGSTPPTNLFYSPFSVRVAMGMTAVGAGGSTLVQMNQALQLNQFQGETQINQAFQNYLGSFCANNNFTLSTANRIYVQKDFPVIQSFNQTLSTYYMSSSENVDFGANPSGVATEINTWVATQTNDTITNLFAADAFSSATVLVLVNAVYFKGTWQTKFDASKTTRGPFKLANGDTVQVPIMHLTSSFKYYDSSVLQSQVLQMNYAGNRLAMHIILPKAGVSLSTVQQKLNSQNINQYMNGFSVQQVEVSLPKFSANFKQELSGQLQSLGMVNVFNKQNANLTGIAPSTTNYGNLYISSVIHQAYVAVDEEGTVAAAATGVVVCRSCEAIIEPPPPIIFNVDRPCIYFICDLEFNQFLFMGNLNNPSNSS